MRNIQLLLAEKVLDLRTPKNLKILQRLSFGTISSSFLPSLCLF